MGYLVQKTRVASLTVGGVDYTDSMKSFEVSDSSANKQGLILTTGTVVLGQRPGQSDIEDYDRNLFKRGAEVILDLTEPGGASYRHPRGLLYVVSVIYDVQNETLNLDVGCRLSLMSLRDDAETILSLVPIPLDPAQQTIQNVGASFSSAGMVLYQDNTGALVSRKFFGTDGTSGVEAGAWVSVLGDTALSVEPLGGSKPIPDEIKLSYRIPEGALTDDQTGKIERTEEISNYFLTYPITVAERVPQEQPQDPGDIPLDVSGSDGTQGLGGCGNTPSQPNVTLNLNLGQQAPQACHELYQTERVNKYLPATRTAVSETTYGAVGGQSSYTYQEVRGPAVEGNPGYFADKYAYCVNTYGYGCNPNGNCPMEGLNTILLSYSETFNEYDEEDNSLVRTIQDSYVNLMGAYSPDDYRSGYIESTNRYQNFENIPQDRMYRRSRVITEYYQEENANIQLTTTFNSVTSRGVGPKAGVSLDALNGIKTTVKRISTTITTIDVRPDVVNSPTTNTIEQTSQIVLNTDSYTQPPTETGPYILDEAIPVPLLSESESEINGWVADYTHYLTNFIKGDLYGLRISEAMRSEIVSSWYPGMPFRYVDTANNRVMAMRMDACTWGVDQNEAILVTNGIFTGFSSGTLAALGDNLVGNSAPNLEGGAPTPPPGAGTPPSITDDLVGNSYAFVIDVDLNLSSSLFTYFNDGVTNPNPTDLTAVAGFSLVPYVSGFTVQAGGLLETEGNGSIPLEYNGVLVTSTATPVDLDVFSAGAGGSGGGSSQPAAPVLTAGTVQVLQHYNGNLTDDSGLSRSFTAESGATTSSGQTKFGSGSLLVSEPQSISTAADTGFDLGTEDFTVELFFYPTQANPTSGSVFETLMAAGGQSELNVGLGWQVRMERYSTFHRVKLDWYTAVGDQLNTFEAYINDADLMVKPNQWNHLVVQRSYDYGWMTMHLNGVRVRSTFNSAFTQSAIRDVSDKTNPIFRVGARVDTSVASFPGFVGYIDDVRVVKSGIRYDMNSANLTVPTSELTVGL